jgi:transposase
MTYLSIEVLQKFRSGKDTLEMAKEFGVSEAMVTRLLWVARCRDKGLPSTFLTKKREVKHARIPQDNAPTTWKRTA